MEWKFRWWRGKTFGEVFPTSLASCHHTRPKVEPASSLIFRAKFDFEIIFGMFSVKTHLQFQCHSERIDAQRVDEFRPWEYSEKKVNSGISEFLSLTHSSRFALRRIFILSNSNPFKSMFSLLLLAHVFRWFEPFNRWCFQLCFALHITSPVVEGD